jgi:hypothetical protein
MSERGKILTFMLMLLGTPSAFGVPITDHGVYDVDGLMIAYTDPTSGITLKISRDRYKVTAMDRSGKVLWSKANYPELQVVMPERPFPVQRPARIARFRPMEGDAKMLDYAHHRGLKGPILVMDYSAGCCGGAEGLISEDDGKLVATGTN